MCCCLEELRCVCIWWQVSPAVLAAFPSAFLTAAATFLYREAFLWLVEWEIRNGKESALQVCWSVLVIYAERGTGIHWDPLQNAQNVVKEG